MKMLKFFLGFWGILFSLSLLMSCANIRNTHADFTYTVPADSLTGASMKIAGHTDNPAQIIREMTNLRTNEYTGKNRRDLTFASVFSDTITARGSARNLDAMARAVDKDSSLIEIYARQFAGVPAVQLAQAEASIEFYRSFGSFIQPYSSNRFRIGRQLYSPLEVEVMLRRSGIPWPLSY